MNQRRIKEQPKKQKRPSEKVNKATNYEEKNEKAEVKGKVDDIKPTLISSLVFLQVLPKQRKALIRQKRALSVKGSDQQPPPASVDKLTNQCDQL